MFHIRVAGWKQREHPMLYNVLHIGDQVLSIAGAPVQNAAIVRDILKSCTSPYVSLPFFFFSLY